MLASLFKMRRAATTGATTCLRAANGQAAGDRSTSPTDAAHSDFQVKLQGMSVPNGTDVTVIVSGDVVCAVPVHEGDASLKLRGGNDDGGSAIEAGERVEIRCGQDVLLRGVLRFD